MNSDLLRKHIFRKLTTSLTILFILFFITGSILSALKYGYGSYCERVEINLAGGSANSGAKLVFQEHMEKIRQNFPVGDAVCMSEMTSIVRSGRKVFPVKVCLTESGYMNFSGIKMDSGSFLTEEACSNGRNTAVISRTLAAKLFSSYNAAGLKMELFGQIYKITGVYKENSSLVSFLNSDGSETVYVPFLSLRQAGKIPVKTILLKDESLEKAKALKYKINNMLLDIAGIPEGVYKINDFYTPAFFLQLKPVFVFLIGIWCILLLIRFFSGYILSFRRRVKAGLADRYFAGYLKHDFLRITLYLFVLPALIGAAIFIYMQVKFRVYIPMDFIPQDNIFDFRFYSEKIREAVHTVNSNRSYISTPYEKDYGTVLLINIILTVCLLLSFCSTAANIKLFKLTGESAYGLLKGIMISLPAAAIVSFLLSMACRVPFIIPSKELALCLALFLLLFSGDNLRIDKSTSEDVK